MSRISLLFVFLTVCFSGTGQNFEMVKDINPSGTSNLTYLTSCTYSSGLQYVSKLFFQADNGTDGKELWISDGTEAGTYMLKNINVTGDSEPEGFTTVGFGLSQKVVFIANNGSNGREIWITNGSEAGTTLLKDINVAAYGSTPVYLTQFYFRALFSADDGVNGRELWITDGTQANTYMVKDIKVGNMSSNPSKPIVYNSKAFFVAESSGYGAELWCTDGTESGTSLVKDINSGADPAFYMDLFGYKINGCVYNNKLYFAARTNAEGEELWVTDGTSSGTTMVKDISIYNSSPKNFFVFNNKLYFTANDDTYGQQLFYTDGTESGTVRITSHFYSNGTINNFTVMNNNFYFFATDSLQDTEPWVSDGTEQGTVMIKNINATGSSNPGFFPFCEYNGYMYFVAKETSEVELFRTDGTYSGTTKVSPATSLYNPLQFTQYQDRMVVYNNSLYFGAAYTTHLRELWKLNDSTTTINPVSLENKIVYPNPARNSIYLNYLGEATIYNSLGAVVKTVSVEPDASIDISDFNEGLYVIVYDHNQSVSKFVKRN